MPNIRMEMMNEKLTDLPTDTQKQIEKMLEDGEVSPDDVRVFNKLLEKASGLSDKKKSELKETWNKWDKYDQEYIY